jgi:hypothetical protein
MLKKPRACPRPVWRGPVRRGPGTEVVIHPGYRAWVMPKKEVIMTSATMRHHGAAGRHAEGRGLGMVVFAGTLVALIGFFNLLDGIVHASGRIRRGPLHSRTLTAGHDRVQASRNNPEQKQSRLPRETHKGVICVKPILRRGLAHHSESAIRRSGKRPAELRSVVDAGGRLSVRIRSWCRRPDVRAGPAAAAVPPAQRAGRGSHDAHRPAAPVCPNKSAVSGRGVISSSLAGRCPVVGAGGRGAGAGAAART